MEKCRIVRITRKRFDPATVLEGAKQSSWGLAATCQWVQLVGADCHIESAPDAGTSLTVEIPLLAEKEGGDGAHQIDVG